MLLARATVREREFGIRVAIGASRTRIVRQLLVESALLAFGGLVAGCLLAYAGVLGAGGVHAAAGCPVGNADPARSAGPAVRCLRRRLATVGFGVFPAVQSARRDVLAGTSIGGRTTAGRRQTRMRGGLVVAQVALSMILLLGAGLLMRSFVKLVGVDLGVDPRNVLITGVGFAPPQSGPPQPVSAERSLQFYKQALERLGSMPGVRSAAVSTGAPPFAGMTSPFRIPGIVVPEQATVLVVVRQRGTVLDGRHSPHQGTGALGPRHQSVAPRRRHQRNAGPEVFRLGGTARQDDRHFAADIPAGARCRPDVRNRRHRARHREPGAA